MLDDDAVRANYTTANSRLKHNWITAVLPVGDDWFAGTYGAGVLRLDSNGEWHSFPDLKDGFVVNPNAMAASGGRSLCGQPGSRAVRLTTAPRAAGPTHRRAALEKRDGARGGRRLSLRRNRQRSGADSRRGAAMIRRSFAGIADPRALPALRRSGVLIPGDRQQPDPAVFSLNEMALDIRIDNGIGARPSAADLRQPQRDRSRRRVSFRAARHGDGLGFRRVGRRHAHPGRDPRAAPRGRRSTTRPKRRPSIRACCRWASAMPTRRGRSQEFTRAHRADSELRHQARRDGIPASGLRWSAIGPNSWCR